MSGVVKYSFEGHDIHIENDARGEWWNAAEVCEALGISPKQVRRLDDDEKGVRSTHTPGGKQRVLFVNEPGLYTLVLSSRKPAAKRFKRWVTHEVLPQIRKTGRYEVQVKLAAFIGDKIAEWSTMFPPDYWSQLDRLYQVSRPDPNKRPQFYAGCVQLVYETFDGDIHDEMKRRVPDPQRSGIRQHQTLSLLGSERMRAHVFRHIGLMDSCSSSGEYRRLVKQVFGQQMKLPLKGVERSLNAQQRMTGTP